METEIIATLKDIFYHHYYNNFLLSNLPNVDQLYIPLSGSKLDTSPNASRDVRQHVPDLQSKIISDLSTTLINKKSYVVFGGAGSGKTTMALSIANEYWKNLRATTDKQVIIPIYFHLPELLLLGQRNDILNLFVTMHLTSFKKVQESITVDEILTILKDRYELLLVLDGYENYITVKGDEGACNLWKDNDFGKYNLKTITFSRPDALTDSQFLGIFSYSVHDTRYDAKYYDLLPFASEQINSYLEKVVRFLKNLDSLSVESSSDLIQLNESWHLTKEITKVHSIWETDTTEYCRWLEFILPELVEVSKTPFILCLLVQVLPTIVEEYRGNTNQSDFDTELIQLVSTEVGIYDQFTRKWFEYYAKKIAQIHPKLKEIIDFLPQLLEIYANNLALRLFIEKQGLIGDGKISEALSEQWDLWKPDENSRSKENIMQEIDNLSEYLPNFKEDYGKLIHLRALRSGCLLRHFNFQSDEEKNAMFQFLHPSLLEYFVSRTIFKGLRASLNFHLKKVGKKSTEFSFSFESIRSKKYIGILRMLVERAQIDLNFKNLLMSVVQNSKQVYSIGIMSSNAFTILTQAFHVWCNENFSYVNIADADMSHCVFVNCNFRGADMSRVLLTGTHFHQCQFQAANLFHCELWRGLTFHLQGHISWSQRKTIPQFQVLKHGDGKRFIYRTRYGLNNTYNEANGDVFSNGTVMAGDLCLFNVNESSRTLIESPQWLVKEFLKLQLAEDVFIAVLQSCEVSQKEQTVCIFELKNESASPMYLYQADIRDQRDKHEPRICYLSALSANEKASTSHTLEIFTITFPNYDEKVVCYRCPDDENLIIATSRVFSLTTSPHSISFSIRSTHEIAKSLFSLHQFSLNSTLLATSSDGSINLYELQKGIRVFQRTFCPVQHQGQNVVTFIRFSPDGKYLLFDMDQTLYIVAFYCNDSGVSYRSCEGVSLRGIKSGYDSLLGCDFSLVNNGKSLVALVYDNGVPVIINLDSAERLQSIKLFWDCETLSFLGNHDQLQLVCGSDTGMISCHKIQDSDSGDPRSIQALDPRSNFHNRIDTDMEHIKIFVSCKGKYMAILKCNIYVIKDTRVVDKNTSYSLLLFRIDGASGKRTFVFEYSFQSEYHRSDIHISFINEVFVCLMFLDDFKVFKCEIPYFHSNHLVHPVQIRYECYESANFRRFWYHESSQQIIFERNVSLNLDVCSVEISSDNSSILISKPRFSFEIHEFYKCSPANIFFHVNESHNFAYIFPLEDSCFIWNINSGSHLYLYTKKDGSQYMFRDVKQVSTISVENGNPSKIYIEFGANPSKSFYGELHPYENVLNLSKDGLGFTNHQTIENSNYCMAIVNNNGYTEVNLGIQPYNIKIKFFPVHNVGGFQLMPLSIDSRNNLRLLFWNNKTISCFEVDLSSMELWEGDKYAFPGCQLLWCDPPNDRFSLLLSNATNTILDKGENWNLLSKRFSCKGKVLHSLESFISLPSLFEQIHESPKSLFSKTEDFVLSNNQWLMFVVVKMNRPSSLKQKSPSSMIDNHSGIVIEGLRHGTHFAFRADLIVENNIYEIKAQSLKSKLQEKSDYLKNPKKYRKTEHEISSQEGDKIIERILTDKQSEIDYNLRYKNCNTWVKKLLSLIDIDVKRVIPSVDLTYDFPLD